MSRIAWLLQGSELYVVDSPQPSASKSSNKNEWTTVTTVIFTPGDNKKQQALEIKGVADNLLGAAGAVIGGTAGLLTGRPTLVYQGAVYGDKIGRKVGEVMWDVIDSSFWRGGSLAGNYNRGQTYGEKGWKSHSGL